MTGASNDGGYAAVARWLEQSASEPIVVICAEASPETAGGRLAVRLEACVSEVPDYRIVDLVTSSGQQVVVALAGCERTSEVETLDAVSRLVGTDRLALETEPLPPSDGEPRAILDVARPPVARRGLLSGRRGPSPVAHEATDEQGRLVESLRRAGVVDADASTTGVRLVATDCNACGLCVRTCPHGALELTHHGTNSRLTHLPDRCQGELVCVSVCPVAGLAGSEALTWQEAVAGPRLLLELRTRRCSRCGARTSRPEGLCDPCQFRRDNPFGSYIPTAARRPT